MALPRASGCLPAGASQAHDRRRNDTSMKYIVAEIRHSPLLWLLAALPVLAAVVVIAPDAHVLLFVLSVLAITPLLAKASATNG